MSKVDDWLKPGAIVPVDVNTTKELVDALRELMKPKAIYHGGSAFPNPRWEGWGEPEKGLTLRDYFASKAMQGMFANPDDGHNQYEFTYDEYVAEIARCAFKMADAMLSARGAEKARNK